MDLCDRQHGESGTTDVRPDIRRCQSARARHRRRRRSGTSAPKASKDFLIRRGVWRHASLCGDTPHGLDSSACPPGPFTKCNRCVGPRSSALCRMSLRHEKHRGLVARGTRSAPRACCLRTHGCAGSDRAGRCARTAPRALSCSTAKELHAGGPGRRSSRITQFRFRTSPGRWDSCFDDHEAPSGAPSLCGGSRKGI